MRTVLVDLPFLSVHRPNLALSILKACLEREGHACDIRYAKLDFAAVIGADLYRTISEQLPHEALVGDFVFAECLDGIAGAVEAVAAFRSSLGTELSLDRRVPTGIWDRLSGLRSKATSFLLALAAELEHYDLVGLNLTFELAPAIALAKLLKQRRPGIRVVLGGGHCEGEMGFTLHRSFPWIDFIARGEGERLLVNLVSALSGGSAPSHMLRVFGQSSSGLGSIPGLIWRDGENSIANGERAEPIEDLDSSPLPDFSDWLPQLAASGLALDSRELAVPFETSRGCWFGQKSHCTFCGLNGPSLAYRSKSAGRVLAELRDLARLCIRNADAVDNILDMKYFDSVLPLLASEALDLALFFEIKANLTREQVRGMAEAGIATVQPGIESLSTPVLRLMRKGATATHNIRLLKWLAEFGIFAGWNILYGFPYEPAEEYEKMARLVPLLVHLQPPDGEGLRVLLNRFSPLFDRPDELGVRHIRPVPGYRAIFGRYCANPETLAYYFAFDADGGDSGYSYMHSLQSALRDWRGVWGDAAFTSVDRDYGLYLFDRRSRQFSAPAKLTGDERLLYLACDAGAGEKTLARQTGFAPAAIAKILARFVERGWVAQIDSQFLSLAVSMDAYVPSGVPERLLESVATSVYRARVRLFLAQDPRGTAELSKAQRVRRAPPCHIRN